MQSVLGPHWKASRFLISFARQDSCASGLVAASSLDAATNFSGVSSADQLAPARFPPCFSENVTLVGDQGQILNGMHPQGLFWGLLGVECYLYLGSYVVSPR